MRYRKEEILETVPFLPKLESLNIYNMQDVTPDMLIELKRRCPTLNRIRVHIFRGYEKEFLDQLPMEFKEQVIIDY